MATGQDIQRSVKLDPHVSALEQSPVRRRWRIVGRVQGVGFRPFIYRLAQAHGLSGLVLNDSCGVIVEAQGMPAALSRFIADIRDKKPSLAIIQRATMTDIPLRTDESGFTIQHSDDTLPGSAGIAPDLASCPQCLADVHNPLDKRRYH